MAHQMADGELLVVETAKEEFVGFVEVREEILVIRSGKAGRPTIVPVFDVLRVTPANERDTVDD